MDMRGRCSAGQKVLACLIIRLALAGKTALHWASWPVYVTSICTDAGFVNTPPHPTPAAAASRCVSQAHS
jgi:hypothetical protein